MNSLLPAHHVGGLLERPERRPGLHDRDRVAAERERGDDAEVAAAAADRPEEVAVLVRARACLGAVREDDVGLEQVVDREPEAAAQVTDPAAEREPADAGRGDDPATGWRGRARGWRASTWFQMQPPPARTVRLAGSTSTEFRPERSSTTPSSQTPRPPPLWPPPRTASSRSWSRANAIVAATSAVSWQYAISGRAPVDHRVVDGARLVVARSRPGRSGCRRTSGQALDVPHWRRSSAYSCCNLLLAFSWSRVRPRAVAVMTWTDRVSRLRSQERR